MYKRQESLSLENNTMLLNIALLGVPNLSCVQSSINYSEELTGGLSVDSQIYFSENCATASLNDLEKSIKIFPNPSSNYINVTIDTEMKAVLFDLLGKELIRENITGRLDISSLEKGTYILNLTDGINTSTHKIIKE